MLGLTNGARAMNAFQAAHAATKATMLRQADKHPSDYKTYAELFKLCLKGYYVQQVKYVPPVEKVKYLWLRGI